MAHIGNIRFMFSKMISTKVFVAGFLVVAAMLTLMYYNTIATSVAAQSALPLPHSAAVSVWLGLIISLGITSNVYVMKVIMGSGKEAMKAASKTALSMLAGAVGCIGSIASVLLSLGVGVGTGALGFLAANILPFFGVALVMSLVSLKLAADTLASVSSVAKF